MKNIRIFILFFGLFGVAIGSAQTGPGDCPGGCFDEGPTGPVCGKLGYYDGDGDGWGAGSQTCYFPGSSGYVSRGGDCNDSSSSTYPRRFYVDLDGDGYGRSTSALICQSSTTPPSGYASNYSDCDDNNVNITVAKNWYQDSDNDTFGDSSTQSYGCSPPSGMANPVNIGGDYDDSTNLITNLAPRTFYFDNDGDTYGISTNTRYQSYAPTGYAEDSGDCDDSDAAINPNTRWYIDSDGDGLGISSALNKTQCTQPPNDSNGSYVLSNNDLCPNEYGAQNNNGCSSLNPIVAGNTNKNWVWSISYDPLGTIKANGINYFDDLGRSEQNQSIDIKTAKIWTSQTLYDSDARPGLQSFSAPIGAPTQFDYKIGFIKKTNGSNYLTSDFESSEQNPEVVGEQINTLGWYYSDINTSEQYQDATDYPFSRTIYSKLNPGAPLRVIGGNKLDTDGDGDVDTNDAWPQPYRFSMKATDELSLAAAFGDANYNNYDIIKTVSRDVHGEENVIFTDMEGKVLAAARSGGTSVSANMRLYIGEQGFVNVHVPKGVTGFTVNSTSLVTVYDMITEQPVTGSTSVLPNGFYRVAINNLGIYTPNGVYVDYKVNYYDYSLNEYDTSGRLTDSYQALDKLRTEYDYDTFGRLIYTKSPDHGEAWFKYRKDGQIRYSQNSEQVSAGEFSYTNYDDFGRPVESGVVVSNAFSSADPNAQTLPTGTKKEVLTTVYNTVPTSELNTLPTAYRTPSFLAGNVAKTYNTNATTYYSYDIYGRAKWILQNIVGLGYRSIDYEYDDISGLVTKVYYQKGISGEQFIHRYTYNEAYELVRAETSIDNSIFTVQAEYEYYETGALKRVELANGSQGVDYVYNLAGQLKSINHPTLSPSNDPGGDTNDLFGMQLDYHNADYNRTVSNIQSTTYGSDQWNGNLKGLRWNNGTGGASQKVYAYQYNRDDWMTTADYGSFDPNNNASAPTNYPDTGTYNSGSGTIVREATNSITLGVNFHAQAGSNYTAKIVSTNGFEDVGTGDYDVTGIEYDPNGNITKLKRNKNNSSGQNGMDDLSYVYKANSNQLLRVDDAFGDAAQADDIDDQTGNNYVYNTIGQLVTNTEEGVDYSYNASGLVTEVQKNNQPLVKFFYNDRNHRVKKESYSNGSLQKTDYYVRDLSGNTINIVSSGNHYPVYGNGRVGIYTRTGNSTMYELTDHLGNVRAVFQKNGSGTTNEGHTDYYPFGMTMPGFSSIDPNTYRYAFQGQEKDPETGKEAFELRLWDARIGRWLTTDPSGQYASPYLGMGNNPINRIDPDGGFDSWLGAFLFKVFTGTKGKIFEGPELKNGDKTFGISNATYNSSGDITDFEINYGWNWERNNINRFAIGFSRDATLTFASFMGSDTNFSLSGVYFPKFGDKLSVFRGIDSGAKLTTELEISFGLGKDYFISYYDGDPKDVDPETYAGEYQTFGLTGGISGLVVGADIKVGYSFSDVPGKGRWHTFYQGAGVSIGPQLAPEAGVVLAASAHYQAGDSKHMFDIYFPAQNILNRLAK